MNSKKSINSIGNTENTDSIAEVEYKFITPKEFSDCVFEKLDDFDGSYIDTVLSLAEEMNIEIDMIDSVISQVLKSNIACEAESLNMMKKTLRLV